MSTALDTGVPLTGCDVCFRTSASYIVEEYRSAAGTVQVANEHAVVRVSPTHIYQHIYRIWNGLPEDFVSAPTLSRFRRRLKPFLFQQSYPDIII